MSHLPERDDGSREPSEPEASFGESASSDLASSAPDPGSGGDASGRSPSPDAPPTVTLLTDFGTRDGYVAAMKGVLRTLVPGVRLDDAGHDVEQGDVRGGGWALARYWDRYPPGTVHLAVVDPGVGTDRRPLAVKADERFLVLPDNGLCSRVLEAADEWRAVATTSGRYWGRDPSRTFHGRDVFAPVAAHLARGVGLSELGPPVEDPVRLQEPAPVMDGGRIEGEVVTVDRFGNLVSNISAGDLPADPTVAVAGERLALSETYASVAPGRLTALVNSFDRLEVAVRNGSAAERLGRGPGLPVTVHPRKELS